MPFGNVVVIWYIFPRFGILCQDKSGNPGQERDSLDRRAFQKPLPPVDHDGI
jgi:hypothetical protein